MSNPAPTLSITDVATYPLPGMAIPNSFTFSKDGRQLAYLHSQDGNLVHQLFLMELASGETAVFAQPPVAHSEADLSLAEKLRRERQRQRTLGITSYQWHRQSSQILLPLNGALYVQDGPDANLRLVVAAGEQPTLAARFSPDGNWIAFVQDAELYVVPSGGGTPLQLTTGARGTGKTNGLAEFIAQEEMGRARGYWWSTDSQWLAFAEVDETHIPVYRIMHQGKDEVGSGAQEDHRYPFAGAANARVRLGVVPISGGDPVWMDLGDNEDIYLARVRWLPDGRLAAQRLNRAQTVLDLLFFDPQTGQAERILQEKSDVWINLHRLFRPLSPDKQQGRFIWGSERSGYQHLYLYEGDGTLVRQLTAGNWLVDSIAGVDPENGVVYFLGSKNGPAEKHLYAVSLAGGDLRQITQQPGIHKVVLDGRFQHFIDIHHNRKRPPTIRYSRLADGAILQTLFENSDPRLQTVPLVTPEIVRLESRDGVPLYGAIYRPAGAGPFPTVISVYGGPHAQRVTDSWQLTADMRAQYLAAQGFLVFKLDNRGSARRGLAFEGWINQRMGQIELQDQVDGVRWLVAQGLADPQRVGVYGWSYGGYMALICLAQAGDIFRVAVAGAPVTHWDGYDTCYTERYMGTPQTNPDGYANSNVMAHVSQIEGKLLLIHGLIDENVHFRHTARLINALIAARKPYDLLLFPDERHMPRNLADRIFMEAQIADYFQTHLRADRGEA